MVAAVGVDGCRAGWFYFRRDGDHIAHGMAASFEALVDALPCESRVFIDIPIGLPDHGPEGRACDSMARHLLGFPRAASVFSAPYRPVLTARSYPDAKERSLLASGKKISRQTYAIVPKIGEVDDFLTGNLHGLHQIREVHPELCFWGLNQRRAMANSKKTDAGFEERLRVLETVLPHARPLVALPMDEFRRGDVARDDIVDALVCLIIASTPDDQLRTAPVEPPVDSAGLPMEIVYTLSAKPSAI